ncbi:MAG TPA: SpoIIE family protein phosphatase [Candidatus Sulfotelmatobacter sp.]|jgi:serine phosphatase RsbU (regulator of sigma subunit)
MHSLFHSRDANSLPTAEPVTTVFPRIEGADIASVFIGKRVAGDFYDSIRVSPERVLFGLLDVSGRRDDNRSVLAAAQEIFRTVGTELFSRSDINESEAMTELSLRINRGLIDMAGGEAVGGVRSCPAFIGCYHEVFGTLCYANAGHTPGLLRDSKGIAELASRGLPLGLFSHATADAPTVGLEKGAELLLVSHGVVACMGQTGDSTTEFGLDRVGQIFRAAPPSGAKALCISVLNAVAEFAGNSPVSDDQTALALVRTE